MVDDDKFEALIQYYLENQRRWPLQRYKDPNTGFAVGSLLNRIKQGTTKISDSQRSRLMGLDPTVFNRRPHTEAARTLTMDEKIDILVVHLRKNNYKVNIHYRDPTTGLALGKFWSNAKCGTTKLTDAQRDRILNLDPHLFDKTKTKAVATTTTTTTTTCFSMDQKIDLLVTYFQKNQHWPPHHYKVPSNGFGLGQCWIKIRNGVTMLLPDQRAKILSLDPNAMSRESTKDQKLDLLVEYFQKNNKWPSQRWKDPTTDIPLGQFFSRIKYGMLKLTETQAARLTTLDTNIFHHRVYKVV